jgi:pimeloyl-ACP methyl ester carboxylesterase
MSTLHSVRPLQAAPETVLCVHASAAGGRSFDALLAPLRDRFALLAPERLGYAAAQHWPVGTPASLDAEAEHLEPLLAARPQGVHLIGHSFGGAVALQMALRWPTHVKSLTLFEPARFALLFGAAETEEAGQQIVRLGRTVCMLVLSGQQYEAAACFVDYWSGEGTWQSLDRRRQEGVIRHMPKVRAEFEAAFSDRTPLAAYRRLTMPVRLIVGGDSPLPSRQIGQLLVASLPRAELRFLPGVGHMGPVTHPQQVAGHLPEDWQPLHQPLAA